MESMAKALSLSSDTVFLKKVYTLLRVGKYLSASQEVIGFVIMAFRSSTVSEKVLAVGLRSHSFLVFMLLLCKLSFSSSTRFTLLKMVSFSCIII